MSTFGKTDIQNKHHDVIFVTILIGVDFSAIKVPVFLIKIDVVSTEKTSHSWFVVVVVSWGPTAWIMQNISWSYGAPIGVVFLIPVNLASGAAVA